MNQKISKYLHWTLTGVLYLILLTPLLVSSKYLFPFITTKTMYFRLLVELAVILYVSLAMLAPKFRPKMTKLSWAIVVFGIIIFITGITGVDFYKTFWGGIERGEGFLTISHLIIYFLILTWTLKTKKEWLNYLTSLVIVGVLVDFYALLQRANVEHFLFWRIIHPGQNRLSATIGNAAFMGAFVLAQFFLSLLLFLKRKHCTWKIFFALATLLNFYVLFQTQTRGALLSWVVMIIFLCLFYATKSPDKLKKNIAIGVLISIIILCVTVWFNRNSQWVQGNGTLMRLTNISRTDITTESRLLAINTSWKGWGDRFILGYGWENYNIAFNKYFPPEIFKDQGSQLWFDRAHNTVFDVAVATGIFGLINYLVIFGLALFYLFKNIKKDFDLSAVLIALLMAHFLQNIFVFDVLATYVLLFTIWAVVNFIKLESNTTTAGGSISAESIAQNKPSRADFNVLIFIPVLLISILAAYSFNIKPLQANRKSVHALIAASINQERQAIEFFVQAIEMNTYQTREIRQKLLDNIILFNRTKTKSNLTDDEVEKNFEKAIKIINDNINQHPWDVQNYLYLMAVLNKAGKYNSQYYIDVTKMEEGTLILSPTRPQTYFEIGQALITLGRFEQGIQSFKDAVALNPKNIESHWNLMTAYILADMDDKVKEEQNFILNQGYNFYNNIKDLERLQNVYLAIGQKNKVTELLKYIAELKPSGTNYARLAAAYNEIGESAKARAAVQKAVELDPSLTAEAEKFLEMLK